jgi:hypothetical protein
VSGWLEAAQVLLKGGRKWWAGWQVGKKLSTRVVPQLNASGSGLSRARPLIDCTKSRMGRLTKTVAGVVDRALWRLHRYFCVLVLPFGCSQIHLSHRVPGLHGTFLMQDVVIQLYRMYL